MITDRTLTNLRTAASLVLMSPGLSVSVEVAGHPVVTALRPTDPSAPVGIDSAGSNDTADGAPGSSSTRIPVCAFHRCVGKAHRLRRSGSQVEMVGVPGDLEPDVVLEASGSARILPSGIVRRTVDDRWVHAIALSQTVDVVESIAEEVTRDLDDLDFELHADRVLEVSVLVGHSPARDRVGAHRVIEALESVAAKATVAGLLELLEPATPDWASFSASSFAR